MGGLILVELGSSVVDTRPTIVVNWGLRAWIRTNIGAAGMAQRDGSRHGTPTSPRRREPAHFENSFIARNHEDVGKSRYDRALDDRPPNRPPRAPARASPDRPPDRPTAKGGPEFIGIAQFSPKD